MSTHRSAEGTELHDAVVARLGIQPLAGRLVPLKTKGEIRASNELIDVYVVELPARYANAVLSTLRSALPASDQPAVDIQHLRRVIKPSFLPAPAHARLASPLTATDDSTRLLLACPTALLPASDLSAMLRRAPPFRAPTPAPTEEDPAAAGAAAAAAVDNAPFPLVIHQLPVPALAPTAAPQAAAWSARFWPVAYKHTNPFGPHPALVARAQAEVEPKTGAWLALAELAAARAAEKGMCAGAAARVGAVVVERRLDANGRAVHEGRVVAVAGDGRGCGMPVAEAEGVEYGGGSAGNVMAHAVMRAIGMVALKRLRLEKEAEEKEKEVDEKAAARAMADPVEEIFAAEPRTEVEREFFELRNLAPNGYLCVDLEIYLTHEPCVMCAMAILHSRFNRCVFARRMPRSGGMTADERGVGHGLFWRPAELNWKFLCWEFETEGQEEEGVILGDGNDEINA